jgi:STAS domain
VRTNTSERLILDFSNVPYVDSAGIGALVGAHVTHDKQGRSLALVGVNSRVRAVLGVTQVEHLFHFFENVQEAQAGVTVLNAKTKGDRAVALCPEFLLVVYSAFTFSACHPFGPFTTSNWTC